MLDSIGVDIGNAILIAIISFSLFNYFRKLVGEVFTKIFMTVLSGVGYMLLFYPDMIYKHFVIGLAIGCLVTCDIQKIKDKLKEIGLLDLNDEDD